MSLTYQVNICNKLSQELKNSDLFKKLPCFLKNRIVDEIQGKNVDTEKLRRKLERKLERAEMARTQKIQEIKRVNMARYEKANNMNQVLELKFSLKIQQKKESLENKLRKASENANEQNQLKITKGHLYGTERVNKAQSVRKLLKMTTVSSNSSDSCETRYSAEVSQRQSKLKTINNFKQVVTMAQRFRSLKGKQDLSESVQRKQDLAAQRRKSILSKKVQTARNYLAGFERAQSLKRTRATSTSPQRSILTNDAHAQTFVMIDKVRAPVKLEYFFDDAPQSAKNFNIKATNKVSTNGGEMWTIL